jgi:hypothetical protein
MADMRTPPTTFSQFKADLDEKRRFYDGDSKQVRFADTEGLYLHRGFSGSGAGSAEARLKKWEDAGEKVFDLLTQDFGRGKAEQVFETVTGSKQPRQELTLGQLDRMQQLTNEVKTELPSKNLRAQAAYYNTPVTKMSAVTRGAGVDDVAQSLLGRTLTDNEVKGLLGLPNANSADVQVAAPDPNLPNADPKSQTLFLVRTGATKPFSRSSVTLYKDREGKPRLYREKTQTGDSDVKGLGACHVVRQANTAAKLGISKVHSYSTEGTGYNGYYTWPRYGANAPFDADLKRGHPDFFNNLAQHKNPQVAKLATEPEHDLQDLMATQDGRDFWRDNGFALWTTFDLSQGSKTMGVLASHTSQDSALNLTTTGVET